MVGKGYQMTNPVVTRRLPTFLAFVALLPIIVGCGGGSDAIISPIASEGTITVEITKSTVPVFRWTTGITVQTIRVMSFGTSGQVDQMLWGYTNTEIAPPVQYGEIIAGGVNLVPEGNAPPLRSGNRYRVQVVRAGEASHVDWIVP
jgi:hypothetical protein